jgi:peptidoglycan hydrolase CwlO-like protein
VRAKVATAISLLLLLSLAAAAGATEIDSLKSKVESARAEAGEIAARVRSAQEQMATARGVASAAAARAAAHRGLPADGERRAAELAAGVRRSEASLRAEKRRLRRAREALAQRLVALYESGSPSTASVLLASSDYEELATRSDYLSRIEELDKALANRVEQVRDDVRAELRRVAGLKRAADAYNERLAAARSEIAAVRAEAESTAAELRSVAAARSASLAELKSKIGTWVGDLEAAEAASRAAAEEEVGRWLGGPYSIPAYIVMCESGGDYGAVNPSSGAGGAYQILPSTWDLYGGEGAPQDASKEEQDRIAAEIWADSGGGAWVCAG